MIDTISKKEVSPPLLKMHQESGEYTILLSGDWNLRGIAAAPELRNEIMRYTIDENYHWDLCNVDNSTVLALLYSGKHGE